MFKLLTEMAQELRDPFANATGIEHLRTYLRHSNDEDTITLDVPGYSQVKSYSCGYVAGLMVLHTFKPRAIASKFYDLVDPDPVYGTQTPRLVKALRSSGVGVSVKNGLEFETVYQAIEKGFPIITAVATADRNVGHWVVIYGVSVVPTRVLLAGTGLLTGTICSWREFRSIWAPKGNGLICWGK